MASLMQIGFHVERRGGSSAKSTLCVSYVEHRIVHIHTSCTYQPCACCDSKQMQINTNKHKLLTKQQQQRLLDCIACDTQTNEIEMRSRRNGSRNTDASIRTVFVPSEGRPYFGRLFHVSISGVFYLIPINQIPI